MFQPTATIQVEGRKLTIVLVPQENSTGSVGFLGVDKIGSSFGELQIDVRATVVHSAGNSNPALTELREAARQAKAEREDRKRARLAKAQAALAAKA